MKKELHHALHTLLRCMPQERERFIELCCEAIDGNKTFYNCRAIDIRSGRRMHHFDFEEEQNDKCSCGEECNCASNEHHHSQEMHAKIMEELAALKESIDTLNNSVKEHTSQYSKHD